MKRLVNIIVIQVILFFIAINISDLYSQTSQETSSQEQSDEITIYNPGTELENDKSVFAGYYDCTNNDNPDSQVKFSAILGDDNISL